MLGGGGGGTGKKMGCDPTLAPTLTLHTLTVVSSSADGTKRWRACVGEGGRGWHLELGYLLLGQRAAEHLLLVRLRVLHELSER